MGVRYKTTFDRTPRIEDNMKSLDGVKVNVGVLTGEHQW